MGHDLIVPTTQATALHERLTDAGANSRLLIPTATELADAGCTNAVFSEQAHGWNRQCLQRVTGAAVAPLIDAAIGRR